MVNPKPTNETGDKLLTLVREIIRQRIALEETLERDGLATMLLDMERTGQRPPRQPGVPRRRCWMRQDEWQLDAALEDPDYTIRLLRTARVLPRYRDNDGEWTYRPLRDAALAEARIAGRLVDLVEHVNALGAAHGRFLEMIAEAVDVRPYAMQPQAVLTTHSAALRRMAAVAPETLELLRPLLRSGGAADG